MPHLQSTSYAQRQRQWACRLPRTQRSTMSQPVSLDSKEIERASETVSASHETSLQ